MNDQNQKGIIYITGSKSNVFLSVVSSDHKKVFACYSGGLKEGGFTGNRRTKKTTSSIFNIVKKLKELLLKNRLKVITVICKMIGPTFYVRMLLSHMEYVKIKVNYVGFKIKKAHNGVRQQKLPRK
jgi:ribosomal protein S11